MPDVASGLLAKLSEVEALATVVDEDGRSADDSWHTRSCGYGQGEWLEPCECDVPAAVLRLCRAHRDLIGLHREGGMVQVGHDTASRFAYCTTCGPVGWPCDTLRAVARGLGVEEEDRNGE